MNIGRNSVVKLYNLVHNCLLLYSCFVLIHRDTTAYVAEVINTIGQASGAAQGLNQPVTTSDRLRNCDEQVVYLMTEDNGKK